MGKGGQSQNLNWPWAINYIIDRLKTLVNAADDQYRYPYFKEYSAVGTHVLGNAWHNVTIYNIGGGAGTDVVTVQTLTTAGVWSTAVTIPTGVAYTFDAGGHGNMFPKNHIRILIATSTGKVHVSGTFGRPQRDEAIT
jgi:hypothetical protein